MRSTCSVDSSAGATVNIEVRTVQQEFALRTLSEAWETARSPPDSPLPEDMRSMCMHVLCEHSTATDKEIKRVNKQLDCFEKTHLFLSKFEMFGKEARRTGGQAVVQFARCPHDNREFAVKFFLDPTAFRTEASLYAAFFPALRKHLRNVSNTPDRPRSVATQRRQCRSSIEGSRFLPHVEAVCDSVQGGLVDPHQRPLPPCIVMERGESLQDWLERAEPDRFASLWVFSNVAARMKDMHAAGFVHMDLKPANVILLPRENRWTVIDFGCSAKINTHARAAFSLTYCPPEVILAAPAMDVWALGVVAFELLTGASAFRILTDGVPKVVAALRGDEPLPWEGGLSEETCNNLGIFAKLVVAMLSRHPVERPSMHDVHASIVNMNGT